MNLLTSNNFINLGGQVGNTPIYNTEAVADAKGRPAQAESTLLAHLGEALGLGSSPALASILGSLTARESEWSREQFAHHDRQMIYSLAQSGIAEDVRKAGKNARSADLRPEVALRAAQEAGQGALGKLRPVLQASYDGFSKRLESARAIRAAALVPQVKDHVVGEMRAVEARRHLFGLAEADRTVALLSWAARGGLESVAAAGASPTGSLVSGDVLRRAEDLALEALGMAWVVQQVEDEETLLENYSSRLDVIRLGVVQSFSGEGYGLQLQENYPVPTPFRELAQSMVDAAKPQAQAAA
ncbi:MAG: hypothetical protein Q7U56_11750 [Humidesulfovibrio sp.]|nr:hypothetical protein [Humidesulfovibrio sp.]